MITDTKKLEIQPTQEVIRVEKKFYIGNQLAKIVRSWNAPSFSPFKISLLSIIRNPIFIKT